VTHRLLLDVSSLGYRSYFALRDVMRAPDGTSVGAVVGYLDMVTRLIVTRRPDEVLHVYDHDWRPTVRTQLYPGYKANRPAEPEELTEQFALLRRVLDLTGMRQAQAPTWEAEDAIGALCVDARDDDRFEMVSGDRDLIQLVRDPAVRLLFTVRGVSELLELDETAVLAKYGVAASRYAELAILRGDPSDELPGVRGVGEKTARALIQTYGSLDELLADAARDEPRIGPLKGKPALRARLREAQDYVAAMRELVPIEVGCSVEVWMGGRDDGALRRLADEHGLRGPVVRLMAALDSVGPAS
jgi:5'-3' exonuclease